MSDVSAEATTHSRRRGRNVGRLGPVDSTRLPLLVTAVVLASCALISAAAYAGYAASAAAIGVLAVVLAAGWPVLVSTPSIWGVRAVLLVGGLALATTVGLTTGSQHLLWVPVAVAISVLIGFLQQLGRPPTRPRLTEGVAGVASGMAIIASGAALVPVTVRPGGPAFITAGMLGLAAGAVVELVGRHRRIRTLAVIPATVAGGLAGWLAAPALSLPLAVGMGLGMGLATFSHTSRRVIGAVPGGHERIAQPAIAVASVLLCGALVLALASLALKST